ncbi:hypothetical protein M1843_16650 [Isoptericola sp. 4D.3]|uniref:Uncharacterized protein n=1 Tax=Isoptericola peretonis TaxID=2918523 RepID=A0ABT0J7E6_9MICO|nr:hypothetical protein [Isoptericola sp. 4D.3]
MAAVDLESPGDPTRRERSRARLVTYTALSVLLVAAVVQVELWPVTAFRLFSSSRGADGAGLTLWAVAPDGTRTDLRPSGNSVLATTGHLYDDLARADADQAQEMVVGWLGVAGIRPEDVSQVVLERATWTTDPHTLERRETSRTVVAAVRP